MAQANTTTSMAQANAAATITATTLYHTYVQATSGTPVLDDPLSDNSRGYHWTEGTISASATNIGTCTFLEGAYHLIPFKGYWIFCGPYSPFPTPANAFSNFAFQVQMKIITGDTGGIGFRVDSNGGYYFYITSEGSYTLYSHDPDPYSNTSTTLKNGLSLAIRTGLNQSNLIAVLAQGNIITFYVNNQYIGSIVDNRYNKGFLVVSVSSFNNPTEVAYSNAKVWKV